MTNESIEANEQAQFNREVSRLNAEGYTDWKFVGEVKRGMHVRIVNTATERLMFTHTIGNAHYYDKFTREVRSNVQH